MTKLTLAVFVLPLTLASFAAQAEEAPASPFTGNVGFVSDYAFRGISQTWERPAIQGGFDYAHPSGFYLGTWASNVSSNSYNNGNMEWDFYGGYKGKFTDDFTYDIGLLQYYYPGAKTATVPSNKYNTTEVYFGLGWKFLSAKYSHTLGNYFGINANNTPVNFNTGIADAANGNSHGSGYLEAAINYELPQKFLLGFHVGHQKVRHYGNLDYTDYKLSLSKEWYGFNFGIAYVDTSAKKEYYKFSANGETKTLSDSRVIVSVSKSF